MPKVEQPIIKIYQKVKKTMLFSKIVTTSFILYFILKWVANFLVIAYPVYEIELIIVWRFTWAIFNVLQIPLWLNFWRLSHRFMQWLGLNQNNSNKHFLWCSVFFSLQLIFNIVTIIDQIAISKTLMIGNECTLTLNTIQRFNYYLLSINILL